MPGDVHANHGADPAPAGRFSRRRTSVALSVVVAVALVAGGAVVARTLAQGEYDAASQAFLLEQATASQAVRTGESAVANAQRAFDDSAGKVLDELPRTALATALGAAGTRLGRATAELGQARGPSASVPADAPFFAPGSGLRHAATEIASMRFIASVPLEGIADELAAPVQAVTDAVAAWESEQDRILAARYTNHVHATGWLAELDACAGSVDVTAHYDGIPTIAEHWSCGGKLFPDTAGTLITLTGEQAGTYRVEGIVAMLSAHRNTTSDLPRGYDLLYQTCQDGISSQMSYTALTRID